MALFRPFRAFGLWGILFPRAALVAKRHFVLPWAVLFGPFGARLCKVPNFKLRKRGRIGPSLTLRVMMFYPHNV